MYIPVWRQTAWGKENREAIKEKLMKFRPRNPELKYVRILLVGSCGAGTSSFITSVNNIFQERITCIAPTNTVANSTLCTNKYKTYKIESGDTDLAFVLSDVMGLPPHIFTGIHPDDVITAIHGQMKDGYKFNPHQPLNDPDIYFRKDPTMSDEVFCLVYILPAFVHGIDHIFEKMKEIRSRIKDLELPQVIILTNVDQACALVKNDLKKIYTSRRIRDQMEYSSEALGVSMCHIFPVKNYHEEISINEDIDVLILQALDQIVHMADDCAFARSNKQN